MPRGSSAVWSGHLSVTLNVILATPAPSCGAASITASEQCDFRVVVGAALDLCWDVDVLQFGRTRHKASDGSIFSPVSNAHWQVPPGLRDTSMVLAYTFVYGGCGSSSVGAIASIERRAVAARARRPRRDGPVGNFQL